MATDADRLVGSYAWKRIATSKWLGQWRFSLPGDPTTDHEPFFADLQTWPGLPGSHAPGLEPQTGEVLVMGIRLADITEILTDQLQDIVQLIPVGPGQWLRGSGK